MSKLLDIVAVITGGASGIGAATAALLKTTSTLPNVSTVCLEIFATSSSIVIL